jgi:hypothetical protein
MRIRRSVIVLAPLFVFAQALSTCAQVGSGLRGLRKADIEVELSGPWSERLGISADTVESQIFVGVRRDLPKLTIDKAASSGVFFKADLMPATNQYGLETGEHFVTLSLRSLARSSLLATMERGRFMGFARYSMTSTVQEQPSGPSWSF